MDRSREFRMESILRSLLLWSERVAWRMHYDVSGGRGRQHDDLPWQITEAQEFLQERSTRNGY